MTVDRGTLLAVTLASVLAGCVSAPESPATHRLVCADGRRFAVTFDPATDGAALLEGGRRRPLARLPSGSGARYGDGGAELWIKGGEAVLSEGRAHLTCRFED